MRPQALKKALDKLEKEGDRWAVILYSALALAMYRNWNMKKTAVTRLIDVTWNAWSECAKDHDKSMIKMCEAETGIEIQNGDGASWHDIWFLNNHIPESMSYEQIVYMRQQQIKWIRPNVMACLMVALHRKYGFGFERCARIYRQIDDTAQEYRSDPKRIRKACLELTGIDVMDYVAGKGEEDEKAG